MTSSRQPSTGVGQDDDTQSVPVSAGSNVGATATGGAGQEPYDEPFEPVGSQPVYAEPRYIVPPDAEEDDDAPGDPAPADPAATDPALAAVRAPAVPSPAAPAPHDTLVGSRSTVDSFRDDALPQRRISSAAQRTGKVRKARLRLLRVEPWSVMKSAFVLSIAVGITFVVATATLWSIIDAAGVFEAVGGLIVDLTESEGSAGLDVNDYVGFSRVVGLATVIAVVDVVLLTALATLFAFLYNLSAALLGGFEITLAEDD